MPCISVVIITFNEERNIGRCLESVKDIADEIVVLDSFSTDGTAEICKAAGVKFYQHEFDGHIQQKNRALALASHSYVLSLDADEALSPELRHSILKIKSKDLSLDGYYMNRLTNYCGQWIRHCGWYPDRKLRLWDKGLGKWGGRNPHDRVEMDEGSKTGFLKGDILHYSYYTVEQHYEQAEKFSGIAANELFQTGKKYWYLRSHISYLVKFLQSYFLRLGILDGYYGFLICKISARSTYQKYYKLYQLNKK